MVDTIELSFKKENVDVEILIALLDNFDFNGYIEEKDYVLAYVDEDKFTSEFKNNLNILQDSLNVKYYISKIEGKNWNEEWEKNYQPIYVEDFCSIRAHFHEPITSTKYEIIVTPQMSFGTGHHETTYLMMLEMSKHNFKNLNVFDYGSGTGVLAILAHKMGAQSSIAIDIDPIAAQNTIDNGARNSVKDMAVKCGTLDIVTEVDFDFILANINRNILLESMNTLKSKLAPNGILLMSGIMVSDKDLMIQKTIDNGFIVLSSNTKGQWINITATHK